MGASVVLVRRPTLSLAPEADGEAGLEELERVSAFPTAHSSGNAHPAEHTANGLASSSTDVHSQPAEGLPAASQHAEHAFVLDGTHQNGGPAPSPAVALPPPEWVIMSLAQQLQQRLGLQLFNFDVLKPLTSTDGHLYCIDINYFPGYEKLPSSVERMVGFLEAVLSGDKSEGRYGQDSYATCIQLTHQSLPK